MGLFGPDFDPAKFGIKLKVISKRLELGAKKKTEVALRARKEVADCLKDETKHTRANIKVEHIIREDYMVDAMAMIEEYCLLLNNRKQNVKTDKKGVPHCSVHEAVDSIVWATVCTPIADECIELRELVRMLEAKYGEKYIRSVVQTAPEDNPRIKKELISRLNPDPPKEWIKEQYLITIAEAYNVPYEPRQDVLQAHNMARNRAMEDELAQDIPSVPEFPTTHASAPPGVQQNTFPATNIQPPSSSHQPSTSGGFTGPPATFNSQQSDQFRPPNQPAPKPATPGVAPAGTGGFAYPTMHLAPGPNQSTGLSASNDALSAEYGGIYQAPGQTMQRSNNGGNSKAKEAESGNQYTGQASKNVAPPPNYAEMGYDVSGPGYGVVQDTDADLGGYHAHKSSKQPESAQDAYLASLGITSVPNNLPGEDNDNNRGSGGGSGGDIGSIESRLAQQTGATAQVDDLDDLEARFLNLTKRN